MGETAYVTIPLTPVPASRPRVGKYGAFYPKAYATWKAEAEGLLAPFKLDEPVTYPVQLFVEIICKKPAKPTNTYPRGDIDNYVKAAQDAVTKSGIYWKDDIQIVSLHVQKRYVRYKDDTPQTRMAIYRSSGKEHQHG